MADYKAVIVAVASLAALLMQWWLSNAPIRRARATRNENTRIHNEIATGDITAIRRRIRQLRAEGA